MSHEYVWIILVVLVVSFKIFWDKQTIYVPKVKISPGLKKSLFCCGVRADVKISKNKDPNILFCRVDFQLFIKEEKEWLPHSRKEFEIIKLTNEFNIFTLRVKGFILNGELDKEGKGFVKIINAKTRKVKIWVPGNKEIFV
jgi:hypothetical protein